MRALGSSQQIRAWSAARPENAYRCRNQDIVAAWRLGKINRASWFQVPRHPVVFYPNTWAQRLRTSAKFPNLLIIAFVRTAANLQSHSTQSLHTSPGRAPIPPDDPRRDRGIFFSGSRAAGPAVHIDHQLS